METANGYLFTRFAEETNKLLGSGLIWNLSGDEGGRLSVAFPSDGSIVIDLTPEDIAAGRRAQIQYNPAGSLQALRRGAIKYSAAVAQLVTDIIPTSFTLPRFGIPRVRPKDDGHRLITNSVYTDAKLEAGLAAYLKYDPNFREELNTWTTFRDVPELKHGNFVSLLAGQFGSDINPRHSLAISVYEADRIRIQTPAETRAGIRGPLERHLDLARAAHLRVMKGSSTHPFFTPGPKMKEIEVKLELALNALDRKDFQAARTGLMALNKYMNYGQMKYLDIPEGYTQEQYLETQAAPYREIRDTIRSLPDLFAAAEVDDNKKSAAYLAYANFLIYLNEDLWPEMASGIGADVTLRGLYMAAADHTVQDSVAHCNDWDGANNQGYVCEAHVTVNHDGVGTPHGDENDSLKPENNGLWKFNRAGELIDRIANMILLEDDASYQADKLAYLDRSWPAVAPIDNMPRFENMPKNTDTKAISRLPKEPKLSTTGSN